MKTYASTVWMVASTAMRVLLALYTVKITAVTLGLSGTGIIGQFNNLLLITSMIAGGGIAAGIVKVATKAEQTEGDLTQWLRSAHGYSLLFSSSLLVAVLVGLGPLSRVLLPVPQGAALLVALALSQFVLFHITALTALLNSSGRQDLFAKSSLLASLISAAAVSVGCVYFGTTGALVGILIGTLSQWAFLRQSMRGTRLHLATLVRPRVVRADLRFWASFTLLSLVTVSATPSAQVAVRHVLAGAAGWEAVGAWHAVTRMSDIYMQFGMLFLSSFYFPALSSTNTVAAGREVILRYAGRILPALAVVGVMIYLCRFFVVALLFSPSFIGVTELFLPQLIGDLFRITSYLFSYALLTRGHMKLAIIAELLQALLFWQIASRLGQTHQTLGVVWGYATTYAIYFPVVLVAYGWLTRQSPRQGLTLNTSAL
jgi:polysaccharide transporter, PST family